MIKTPALSLEERLKAALCTRRQRFRPLLRARLKAGLLWILSALFLSASAAVSMSEAQASDKADKAEEGKKLKASQAMKEIQQPEVPPVAAPPGEGEKSTVPKGGAAGQKSGVRILKVKKRGLFSKLSLKEKDIISRLNGRPVRSARRFFKQMQKAKKKASFQITVLREGRRLLLTYKTRKKSGRRVYQLISSKEKKDREPPPPSSAPPPPAKKKASLLKKHKRLLQKGFILHAGAATVYERPSFDSKRLFVIPFGDEVVISKKILRPEKEIGSFYKVFIQEPQKTAGYISEIDILPQNIKKQGAYVPNPEYSLWKKSANKKDFLEQDRLSLKNGAESASASPSAGPAATAGSRPARYFGPASALVFDGSDNPLKERLQFGVQLSGHDLLIPGLNMDIRFLLDSTWDGLSVEATGTALFLNAGAFKAGPAGGLRFYNRFDPQDIFPDAAGGLSGLLPLSELLILRGDLFWTGFFQKPRTVYFMSALQWRF